MRLNIKLPKEFIELCAQDSVNPEIVLRGFIADLCGIQNWVHPDPSQGRFPRPRDGYQSNGSDERLLAREYYERVGHRMIKHGS
jgi:hypothetical protein